MQATILTTAAIDMAQTGSILPCLIKYTNCAKYSSNTQYIKTDIRVHKTTTISFSFVLMLEYVTK